MVAITGAPAPASALVIIDSETDSFTNVGDFDSIKGNDQSSSPGQVLELLSLQSNGSESGSNIVTMGQIYSTLAAGGLSYADRFVIGFGLNETGPTGSNSVVIEAMDIAIQRSSSPTDYFSLTPDLVQVYNFHQGGSTAEALFEISLGFDLMAEYSASSSENFAISAYITNTSDGGELFFLSSGFTETAIASSGGGAIPEPSTALLLGFGLAAMSSRQVKRSARIQARSDTETAA